MPSDDTPLTDLLTATAPPFLHRTLAALHALSPSLVSLLPTRPLDHLCLRTSTPADYTHRQSELAALGASLLVETPIGGRPVSTWLLPDALAPSISDPGYEFGGGEGWAGAGRFGERNRRVVRVLEVPAPKPGRAYEAGWEHVEVAVASEDEVDAIVAELERAVVAAGEGLELPEALSEASLAARARQRLEEVRRRLPGVVFDERGMGKGFNMDLRIDFEVVGEGAGRHGVEVALGGDGRTYRVSVGKEEKGLLSNFSVKLHWLPLELVVAIETLWEAAAGEG
ncbi:hypothetical protein HDU96_007051 [Phlyctochytrium bullatum]|nr:hypothetical protein HDU96_007051 [Phlyctochytrium bullatum]